MVLECERNPSADTKVSEEGGGGGALEEGMPLQPLVRRQAVPPSPWRGAGEQMPACSPGREEPTPEQGDAPQDGRDSMGKPALEQAVTEDRPAERTHAREVREELRSVERTHAREVREELRPAERTHAREVCEELRPAERTHAREVRGGLAVSHGGAGAE